MFRRLASGGLGSRLVLIVLLALAPVLAASTIANVRQRSRALEAFVTNARATTAAMGANLDRIAQNTHALLIALQEVHEVSDAGAECRRVLLIFLKVDPFLTNIGLVEPDGSLRCSALDDEESFREATWFRRALHERDFVTGESRPQAGTPQREIVFAQPMIRDGRVTAVFYATFGLTWLDRLLQAYSVGHGTVVNVIDPDGVMLYRSERAEEFVGTRVPLDVLEHVRESDRIGNDTTGLDGALRRYVTTTWGTDRRNPLLLAIGYPTAVVLEPFNRLLILQTLFLLLGVLIALVAGRRVARTLILRPVATLVSAVARVRAGDLATRVAPSGGPELKQLSEAFNLTVETLQQNQSLEEQLRVAQRLQAIGHLAGGVAHEFNNMLTVIIGNAELLLDEDPVRPEYRAIRDSAERSRVLTHQLLAFSRRQLLQPRQGSVNELVRRALSGLGGVLGPRISVELQLAPGEPEVFVDGVQFQQVLLNVLLNAREAMPDGGHISIATAPVTVFNGSIDGLTDGDYVELTVADTGSGMDQDTLAHALEPFFTTKPFGQGAGLGLSTAYGIVRQSGGQLSLASQPGKGTTVRIYLPAQA